MGDSDNLVTKKENPGRNQGSNTKRVASKLSEKPQIHSTKVKDSCKHKPEKIIICNGNYLFIYVS